MIKGKSNRLTGKAQLRLCCGAHQVFCSSLLQHIDQPAAQEKQRPDGVEDDRSINETLIE